MHTFPTYRRAPLTFVRGEGAWLWDEAGHAYLDFVSGLGVTALGHAHPAVVAAIRAQAGELLHVSNLYYTAPAAYLAEALTRLAARQSPEAGRFRVFFANSGAEAVEAALKLARRAGRERGGPAKHEVVVLRDSFHGRTFGALSATARPVYQAPFEPLVPGFRVVPRDDLAALRAAVDPARTAAVLLEVVQGEAGVWPVSRAFLQEARRLCDTAGALLLVDEIQTGLGRTGRWFAFEHGGIAPDGFTLAKALGGGLPIGALVAREPLACLLGPGQHASTFGGNPVACRAALAVLQVLEEAGLVQRAREMGERLAAGLEGLAARHPRVRGSRGLGLMRALALEGGAPAVAEACRQEGLLVNAIGEDTLRLLPPLVVTEAEVDDALARLDRALARVGPPRG